MKKITLLISGLMLSGVVFAEPFSASGPLRQGNCNNLNEDVTINLTSGVVAGVSCTAARVAIATCHTSGMVKSRTVGTKTIAGPDDEEGNPTTVTMSCSIGTADPACAGTPVTGPAIANASTTRGTVTTSYSSAGGTCSGADVPDTFVSGVN